MISTQIIVFNTLLSYYIDKTNLQDYNINVVVTFYEVFRVWIRESWGKEDKYINKSNSNKKKGQ